MRCFRLKVQAPSRHNIDQPIVHLQRHWHATRWRSPKRTTKSSDFTTATAKGQQRYSLHNLFRFKDIKVSPHPSNYFSGKSSARRSVASDSKTNPLVWARCDFVLSTTEILRSAISAYSARKKPMFMFPFLFLLFQFHSHAGSREYRRRCRRWSVTGALLRLNIG